MKREFERLRDVVGLPFAGELESRCMTRMILLFGNDKAVLLVADGDEDGCSLNEDFPHGHHTLVNEWGFDKGELISHNLLSDDDLEQLHKVEQNSIAKVKELRRKQYEDLKKEFGDG